MTLNTGIIDPSAKIGPEVVLGKNVTIRENVIIEANGDQAEVAINASKANPFCAKCGKGTRVKTSVKKDGTKVRVCAKCGEEIK